MWRVPSNLAVLVAAVRLLLASKLGQQQIDNQKNNNNNRYLGRCCRKSSPTKNKFTGRKQ
jgi:hypothetical protein